MTVHQFGTFDAKNKLSHLLDLVEQGDEVIITRNGKPVARIVPDHDNNAARMRRIKADEAIDWIKANRKQNDLGGDTIKELIESGRRY